MVSAALDLQEVLRLANPIQGELFMSEDLMVGDQKVKRVSKEQLIELLNGDLSRE